MESISPAYGLATGEPLEVEKVLTACFSNPERKKFPEYPRLFDSCTKVYLWDGAENAQYFTEKLASLAAKTIPNFNGKKLNLQTLEHCNPFENTALPEEQVEKFRSQIKDCKWCGPYKHEASERYYFYSIADSGANECYVTLLITFIEFQVPSVYLTVYDKDEWIADQYNSIISAFD